MNWLQKTMRVRPSLAVELARERLVPKSGIHQCVTDARLTGLRLAVEYIYGACVPGNVVEFGTAFGTTAKALAETMALKQEARHLWMLDSFCGFPESKKGTPDADLPSVQRGWWGEGRMMGLSEIELAANIKCHLPEDRFTILKGWYNTTAWEVRGQVALVHVDCDLYQSTVDALTPLFANALLSKGAMLVFDDWDCNLCDDGSGERRAWAELARRYDVAWESHGHYGAGQHKLVVHSYKRWPVHPDKSNEDKEK